MDEGYSNMYGTTQQNKWGIENASEEEDSWAEDMHEDWHEEGGNKENVEWKKEEPLKEPSPENKVEPRSWRDTSDDRPKPVFTDWRKSEPHKQINDVSPGQIDSINLGFGQNIMKMSREAWGAARPLPRPQLDVPVSKVRFTHTGTAPCNSTDECMRACKDIQKYYMDLGFADIPYNFLVGGDGVLYQGRGWQKQADRPPSFTRLRKACLDLAFIGNFEETMVPYSMLSVGTDFIKLGMKIQKITPFYQLYNFVGEKRREE